MDKTLPSPTLSWGGRLILWTQCAVLVGYAVGAFGILLTSAVKTGDYAGLLDPGVSRYGDPKGSIPPVGPASEWNPLFWIFGIARLFGVLGLPLASVGVLLGLGYLVRQRSNGWRGVGAVAIGTATCVAMAVLASSPYGEQLRTWLLD